MPTDINHERKRLKKLGKRVLRALSNIETRQLRNICVALRLDNTDASVELANALNAFEDC